jgi:hypothetical protein
MVSQYIFEVTAFAGAEDFLSSLSLKQTTYLRDAVAKGTRDGRARAAKEIQKQVNLPRNYLSGQNGRLTVTKVPKTTDLEGIITGTQRPTSLARFAKGAKKTGIGVEVKPGKLKFIPGAFFLNLRSGNTDTAGNKLLAVRTKGGAKPKGAYKPKKMAPGLWLLYGPSVDQVFGRERGVAQKISPYILDIMEREYLRRVESDF